MNNKLILTAILVSIIFCAGERFVWADHAPAKPDSEKSVWWESFTQGFDHNIKLLSYVAFQEPAASTQNPGNDFLKLPRYSATLEVRPDFRLILEPIDLSLKPRIHFEWEKWEHGTQDGRSSSDDDWYINEWLARIGLTDTFFISYGRENIQWGPSYLASVSNPFFSDNGKLNPKQEVRGLDFFRMVWMPSDETSLSVIANLDEGAQDSIKDTFEKKYALKFDYIGSQHYMGVVLSHETGDRNRVGGFAGWTASDAVLLYAEGVLQKGSPALYPDSSSNYLGMSMEDTQKNSSNLETSLLVGGTYTLEAGPTLTMEYLHNSMGYNDAQARNFYELRKDAAAVYDTPGPFKGLSLLTLSGTVDTGLKFLRKNYIMIQCRQSEIWDVLDLGLSYIHNFDDGSKRLVPSIDYSFGDHTLLFLNGVFNIGDQDTEFGSIIRYQFMAGIEYSF